MGRYQPSSPKQPGYNEGPEFHPIWRGIGFAMIVLIPFISYFAGLMVIDANKANNYVPIPPNLVSPYLGDPDLYLKIIMTVAISFVIYTVFLLITFLAFRLFGPSRYGPTDSLPPRRKIRRRY